MSSAALLVGVPRPAPTTLPDGRTMSWPALHGVETDLAAVAGMLRQAVDPLPSLAITTLIAPGDTTASNILGRLDSHVARLEHGDTLIVLLDGHGYHVPDADGDDGDGWDEVYIASDGVPIRDDEFAARWRAVDPTVTIIGLVDSCYADTSGLYIDHPAKSLPEPALAVTVRTQPGPARLFFSASLAEQTAYETHAGNSLRGVLTAALTDVWSLTDGARESYASLFGYAQQLATIYDARQTTRVRFAGPSALTLLEEAPFCVAATRGQ